MHCMWVPWTHPPPCDDHTNYTWWKMASQTDIAISEHEIDGVVRGHHVYKTVWMPFEEEILSGVAFTLYGRLFPCQCQCALRSPILSLST